MIRYLLSLIMVIVALGLPLSGQAQTIGIACPGLVNPLSAKGFQTLSVGGTAAGLTVPSGSLMAVVTVETVSVRYRDDGTAPTASVGTLVPIGNTLMICGSQVLGAWSVIATSATASLDVSYYGR